MGISFLVKSIEFNAHIDENLSSEILFNGLLEAFKCRNSTRRSLVSLRIFRKIHTYLALVPNQGCRLNCKKRRSGILKERKSVFPSAVKYFVNYVIRSENRQLTIKSCLRSTSMLLSKYKLRNEGKSNRSKGTVLRAFVDKSISSKSVRGSNVPSSIYNIVLS